MEKEFNKIEELIDLFYNGETSLEQEQELYGYFLQEDVPAGLQQDKELFLKLYSLNMNDVEPPKGFDGRLDSLIDNLARNEKKDKRIILWKWAGGIAAAVALIFSITFITQNNKSNGMLSDTYSTPEEAYEETEKTLLLVSSKLNKGFAQWEKAEENISKVNKIVYNKLH